MAVAPSPPNDVATAAGPQAKSAAVLPPELVAPRTWQPTWAEAEALVDTLGDEVLWYKIGYQLAYAGGLPLVSELARAGKQVFLDLKLLDISNTVQAWISSPDRMVREDTLKPARLELDEE